MEPILERLDALYAAREEEIERWLGARRTEAAPFLYNSVDLRHSGMRLAPVDTNLYPAGFNNLSANAEARAGRFTGRWLEERHPGAKRVLIVPENHTRNLAYLDNLASLKRIFEAAGMQTEIGSLEASEPLLLLSRSGLEVREQPLAKDGGTLRTKGGFTPDVVVLNNDCTTGIPAMLQGVRQPIAPPPSMGWWKRRKSAHFAAYHALAEAFAAEFDLDAWLISAGFLHCGRVDFKASTGLDCVAKAVDTVIAKARAKHRLYGISGEPYAFVKADSGTYGMGIMTVHSGSEILELNKKARNKMQVVKEGAAVSEVIVQEGIATADAVNGKPAEPMIYLIDGLPTGGMFRVNGERDAEGNLNAAGVEFTGMCDEAEAVFDCRQPIKNCNFRAYGLVAALAALAVPREQAAETAQDSAAQHASTIGG